MRREPSRAGPAGAPCGPRRAGGGGGSSGGRPGRRGRDRARGGAADARSAWPGAGHARRADRYVPAGRAAPGARRVPRGARCDRAAVSAGEGQGGVAAAGQRGANRPATGPSTSRRCTGCWNSTCSPTRRTAWPAATAAPRSPRPTPMPWRCRTCRRRPNTPRPRGHGQGPVRVRQPGLQRPAGVPRRRRGDRRRHRHGALPQRGRDGDAERARAFHRGTYGPVSQSQLAAAALAFAQAAKASLHPSLCPGLVVTVRPHPASR